MSNITKTKINCLLSILISNAIWLFTYFYLFVAKKNILYLPITFYFPIILQILAILLAIYAYKSSSGQSTKISSLICFIYSILSLVLFFVVNNSFLNTWYKKDIHLLKPLQSNLFLPQTRWFSCFAPPPIESRSRKLACKQAQTLLHGFRYARKTAKIFLRLLTKKRLPCKIISHKIRNSFISYLIFTFLTFDHFPFAFPFKARTRI